MAGILLSALVSGLCFFNNNDSVARKMVHIASPARERPVYYCIGTPAPAPQYSGSGRCVITPVECDKQRIYVNSTNTVITIESNRLLVGTMEISVYDEKDVAIQQVSLPKGLRKQEIQLSSTLSSGLYVVSGTQQNTTVFRERLVVIGKNEK